MRRVLALLAFTAIGACVAPPRPAPVRAPVETAPPPAPAPVAAPRPADWRDWAFTRGDWRYRRFGAATAAEYGDATAVHAALRCESGSVRLVWPAAQPGQIAIRTSTTEVFRTATAASEGGAQLVFPPRDSLLDAMAFSRGRFVLQSGTLDLVLPPWPEVARVIEDCR